MTWSLAHIFRHPVKSLGEEALGEVDLATGKPMPFDRRWAIAHGAAEEIRGWAGPKNFINQTHVPRFAQIRMSFLPESHTLRLSHPDLPDLTIRPGSVDGDDALSEWVEPLTKGTTRSGPFLVYEVPGVAFTDFEDTHISIGSEASRRALGQLAGRDLEHIRFRMNLWVDGMSPWEEFELGGREIEIGEARLKITERVTRCNATAASPSSGARDVPVTKLLDEHLGHQDFGIYAQVIRAGTVRVGDEARLV